MSFDDLMGTVKEISDAAFEKGEWEMAWGEMSGLSKDRLVQMCYVEIPAMFQPFTQTPDPHAFAPLVQDLQGAMSRLCTRGDAPDPITGQAMDIVANTVLGEMTGAGSLIEDWDGRAARQFKAKFIDPFPELVNNQFLLLATLKSALAAEQSMWSAMRRDVDDIARESLKAFRALHSGGYNWTMVFTVVAAVTGFAASIPTEGASIPLTLSAISAASWVGAGMVGQSEEPPKQRIQGSTVSEVFDEMMVLLQKEILYVNQTEERIAHSLRGDNDEVLAHRDTFVAPPPALINATRRDITNADYMGSCH